MGKRKTYSESFKAEAIEMVVTEHLSMAEVSRRLRVSYPNLCEWVNKHRSSLDESGDAVQLKEVLKMLKKRLREAEMERDILKKTIVANLTRVILKFSVGL